MNPETIKEKFSGIFVPISTPFLENEEVDYEGLVFNLHTYGRTKVKGYLALGSNGENKSLTEEERTKVLETIVSHKAKSQVVMAGAAYEAQRDVERFFKQAGRIGADFGLLLSPSYFKKQMTDDILFRFFMAVADTSPMPILIYNAPEFNGMSLSPQLVHRLSAHPNIVGMKDSSPSGIENFLEFANDQFLILAGSINFLFLAMMRGAVGGTVSLANSFPHIAFQLFEYGMRRNEAEGIPLQEKILRINKAISGKYGVPGVKAAMSLAGLKGGIPRRPLLPLTEIQREELRAYLVKEGVLDERHPGD